MTDLYARLGIDFDQLGCVMLDCEPPSFFDDAADYLSVSTEPANCTGMQWPCPTVQAVGQAIGAGK